MSKKYVNTALAVLLALGITACSSGGDNAKNNLTETGMSTENQKIPVKVNNTKTDEANNYTSNLTASEEDIAKARAAAQEAEARAEAERKRLEEEQARKAEEERLRQEQLAKDEEARKAEEARLAKADLIKNGLVSSVFNKEGTESYAYLNDESKKALLLKTLKENSSTCKTSTGVACTRDAEKGNIILSDYQSYAGYAVVREDMVTDQPRNAYLAVVETPTKEKSMVVDATYKGSAVYTAKNINNYTGYTARGYNTDLTLNVKDNVVSGDIKMTTGRKPTLVTFENADIQVANDAIVFEGVATFNTAAPLSLNAKDEQGNKLDTISGAYRGQFAGERAEEVVGTFETNNVDKDVSVQGAFMGVRQ